MIGSLSAGSWPERSFAPVIGANGCVGHRIRSAKSFSTFDADNREIGTYRTPDAGVAELLELAVAKATQGRNLQNVAKDCLPSHQSKRGGNNG